MAERTLRGGAGGRRPTRRDAEKLRGGAGGRGPTPRDMQDKRKLRRNAGGREPTPEDRGQWEKRMKGLENTSWALTPEGWDAAKEAADQLLGVVRVGTSPTPRTTDFDPPAVFDDEERVFRVSLHPRDTEAGDVKRPSPRGQEVARGCRISKKPKTYYGGGRVKQYAKGGGVRKPKLK